MRRLSKSLKRVLASAVLTTMMVAAPAAYGEEGFWQKIQKEGVLVAGGAASTPYQMRNPETDEWEGVYIEILRRFAKQLDVELKVVDTTWDNLVAGLIANKWDIAPALNRTVKRSLVVNYSIPAHAYQISFVFKKSNDKLDPTWTRLKDFDKEGIVFALKAGTVEASILPDQLENATVKGFPGQDELRLAVISGRADIAVDDADPNSIFAASYPEWSATVLPTPPLARQGVAFGFNKSVPLQDIQTFNILVEEMVAKGEVEQMFADWAEKLAKTE